jgi:oxaloacetate decarboxylase gamma subunit
MNDEIINLLFESANLLAVGMIVVFVFLSVLIGAVKLMSAFIQKFPEPSMLESSNKIMPASQDTNSVSPDVAAAISAAIHQYRQK